MKTKDLPFCDLDVWKVVIPIYAFIEIIKLITGFDIFIWFLNLYN